MKVNWRRAYSAILTLAASGVLVALAPPKYRPVVEAVTALALTLHPSPVTAPADAPATQQEPRLPV